MYLRTDARHENAGRARAFGLSLAIHSIFVLYLLGWPHWLPGPDGDAVAVRRPAQGGVVKLVFRPETSPEAGRRKGGLHVPSQPVSKNSQPHTAGDLRPELLIRFARPNDLLEVLSRHDGRIGIAYANGGREIAWSYRLRTGAQSYHDPPVKLEAFFAVHLLDIESWNGLPPQAHVCTTCEIYALFPAQMSEIVAARVLAAVGDPGRMHRTRRVEVCFYPGAADGFTVQHVEFSPPQELTMPAIVKSDRR